MDSTWRTNYELFVSEAGGKVLFDSIVDYNKTITADLQTSAGFLDVTVIYSSFPVGSAPQYFVYTYKTVNLAQWKNVPLSDSVPGQMYPFVTGTATMQLTNVAAPAPFDWQFMTNDDPGPTFIPADNIYFSSENISYSNNFSISYPWEQDDYAYIAFPYSGLYKLHKINGQVDSVDLSQLDTAKKISFNWPAQYDITTKLWGYMDTTNRTKSLLLVPSHGEYNHNFTYEAMYPANNHLFQKYDVVLTGYPNNYGQGVPVQASLRWTWLDTIPLNVPFLDQSYFNVTSQTPDNFTVNFPKVKPTFYMLSTSFNVGEFLLTAPGDSTSLDPEIMLVRLQQGKLLKGSNPAMFINGFILTIDDEPNYQPYMTKQGDVTAANKRPMSNQNSLSVGLGYQGGAATTKFFRQNATFRR